jgi:hypothetical protein
MLALFGYILRGHQEGKIATLVAFLPWFDRLMDLFDFSGVLLFLFLLLAK